MAVGSPVDQHAAGHTLQRRPVRHGRACGGRSYAPRPDLQLARSGERAQARGQVHRAAPHAVPGRRPGRRDEHVAVLDAGVHGRADGRRAAGRYQFDPGADGPFGLVAGGVVQSEDAHEPVTQHLLDLTAVPERDRDQVVHERTHDLVDDLRLDGLHQFGEAAEIGEEYGGHLPVAFGQSDVHDQPETRPRRWIHAGHRPFGQTPPRSWTCGWRKPIWNGQKGNHNSKIAGNIRSTRV